MFLAGCRHRQKVFLDFIRRIRYNSYVVDTCRCVGMADEGDSKSLVLITRVGSTPTTGIKRKSLQLVWGASFLSAACERVEQHDPAQQGSNQPCGLLLSARETPTTGSGPKPPHSKSLSFDASHPGPPNLISRITKPCRSDASGRALLCGYFRLQAVIRCCPTSSVEQPVGQNLILQWAWSGRTSSPRSFLPWQRTALPGRRRPVLPFPDPFPLQSSG